MQVAVRSAMVRAGRFAVVPTVLWGYCVHMCRVTRMAAGFARHSVLTRTTEHVAKKTAGWLLGRYRDCCAK
jgi:hypothetical protein